jgi:hypothetical protein
MSGFVPVRAGVGFCSICMLYYAACMCASLRRLFLSQNDNPPPPPPRPPTAPGPCLKSYMCIRVPPRLRVCH